MVDTYIASLVEFCNSQYVESERRCEDCKNDCQGSCELCLQAIFRGMSRRYNCRNIVNYYVCKYLYKYSSEITYLLKSLPNFFSHNDTLKVLSVGCGPASELFGIIKFLELSAFNNRIEYYGVDLNKIWLPIHEQIKAILTISSSRFAARFSHIDIFKLTDKFAQESWKPNILILQYVLSDMLNFGEDDVEDFINNIINKLIKQMPFGSYLIINDINLGRDQTEPRYYYTKIFQATNKITSCGTFCYHFKNEFQRFYPYGQRHPSNNILFSIPDEIKSKYDPWRYCSSAQIAIQIPERSAF
jgi:hypothetical protein